MDTAPVKAIALPAVYRANLEFHVQSHVHVPFQHSRTRSRIRGAWKTRKLKRTRTRTAETECNHIRPFENTQTSWLSFVSTVIMAATNGGKDNPIEISSGDEDVDQR